MSANDPIPAPPDPSAPLPEVLGRVELRHLQALRAVAEERSFGRAAAHLGYTQSAVSQQIANLEAEVGEPLVLELRGGPVLTDAGRILVGHAESAMARLEQAERELASLSGLETGELRLVSFASASAIASVRASQPPSSSVSSGRSVSAATTASVTPMPSWIGGDSSSPPMDIVWPRK